LESIDNKDNKEGQEPIQTTGPAEAVIKEEDKIQSVKAEIETLMAETGKVYVGQEDFVRLTLVALFAGGHVLIESVPGLGKTLLVRILGEALV